MEFTIEAIMSPVVNDDWTDLHRALDVVPGSILMADPEAPVLVIPVTAESAQAAERFLHGLAQITGLDVVAVSAREAEDVDVADGFIEIDEEAQPSLAVQALSLYAHAGSC